MLGQILSLPTMIYRIEQTFSELNTYAVTENELLETIKVPKKLFSLINKLPKPTYKKKKIEVTNESKHLPDIKKEKLSQHSQIFDSNKAPSKRLNISKLSPSTKNIKMSVINLLKANKDEIKDEYSNKSDVSTNIKATHHESNFSIDDNEDKYSSNISDNKSYIKKSYHSVSPNVKINNQPVVTINADPNQDIVKLIKNKYLKKKRVRNNPINIQNPINKSDLYDYKGSHASYIRQIINRKSPIGRPLNYNMKLLANIYSGNSQLSSLPRKLPCIKRPKILLKQGEYSLPSILEKGDKSSSKQKLFSEDYEKLLRAKGGPILDKINLLNCNRDIQGLKIQPKSLLPEIHYKKY